MLQLANLAAGRRIDNDPRGSEKNFAYTVPGIFFQGERGSLACERVLTRARQPSASHGPDEGDPSLACNKMLSSPRGL